MGNVLSLLTKVRCFLLTGSVAPQYLTAPPVEEEKMVSAEKIVSVTLHDNDLAQGALYRLQRGTILRLQPGPSLLGKHITLYTNYLTNDKTFIRTSYRILDWCTKDGRELTTSIDHWCHVYDTDIYSQVQINVPGTYHFYFKHKDNKTDTPNGAVRIQVEPTLKVGPPAAQKVIPLNSVRCQTVLSKNLGKLSTWENKLRVAKESGYNMIHFTPIQSIGESRSCYSLKNQLQVNQEFGDGHPVTFANVETVIKKMREEWGVASICDIVLNHTANESEWLKQHPDATYSCATSPYLRPAFLLDALVAKVGQDVLTGALEHGGVPQIIDHEHHLEALKYQLHSTYLPQVKLHELYQCDVNKYVNKFIEEIRARTPPKNVSKPERNSEVVIIQDPDYKRLACTINFDLAIEVFNVFHPACFDEDCRLKKCAENFRSHLDALNESIRCDIQHHLNCAVDSCLAGIRYERVDDNGPHIKEITIKHPVFMKYFTHTGSEGRTIQEIELMMYKDSGKFFMAHNGWVMGSSDPLQDFAKKQPGTGNVYLRRELISWGDSVKLRYGDKPEDSPYLWKHMKEYVDTTAKLFDGVRLDNCHSTPLPVAEYLLDSARKINPELYVVAELFTNSDHTDNVFVNRLGITSLIREALSAWDSHEEGRLVYRYGGDPVGAFHVSPQRPLKGAIAHALFLDLTHDNPSPVEKRSVFDMLPSAALVSMACCATGSNRGYDELVPHHIHVVDEERQYQEWGKNVKIQTGIISAKRALNILHGQLAEEGFSEVFVDQMDENIVAVTRHSPKTHQSVILVAHTAFSNPAPFTGPSGVKPLCFEGCLDEIIFEAELHAKTGNPYEPPKNFTKDKSYINGCSEYEVSLREHIPLSKSNIFDTTPHIEGNLTKLNFKNLKPGTVVAIRCSLHSYTKPNLNKLQEIIPPLYSRSGKSFNELKNIVSKLDLVDLNRILFTCDHEERDRGFGGGAYNIPGYGDTVYCGLQGFVSILTDIAPSNDLGHPLCNNLRLGDWMMDYISGRLFHEESTVPLANWFKNAFEPLKNIPRYLIPSYFDAIVTGAYDIIIERVFHLMSNFIKDGSNFPQSLALATLQFLAKCNSANLPTLSPNIEPPKAPQLCATLSAGLPHFSTGYMRCWGRDTFIALRGLLLLTGRYNEARYIILGFGNCLRHGLIPNLLDNGSKPRFNCRDAIWWWMHSIKQYVQEVPNGRKLLKDKVSRLFPTDDSPAQPAGSHDQTLIEAMQEALQIHFQGLLYRERNAGTDIDAHMKDQGFNVQIGVNPDTGFVFGGNEWNCGTWMDKMGSSEKAGNRGTPSSPRDGSAVELVGLQMSVLRFMQGLSEEKVISYKGVTRTSKTGAETFWSYKEWAELIRKNFEDNFFVDDIAGLANKRGIYKDTVGSSHPYTDFQLRCNFPIAMVVAPELFNAKHAWEALEKTGKYLVGPLGMKTLDPEDWAYRADYDNSNDSNDPSVAHGANYHQGPEWVWPIGFYLRAKLIFAKKLGTLKETVEEIWDVLKGHLNEMQTSHWRGLPELTNSNGSYCRDSCRTQAWSIATILEVLYDLKDYTFDDTHTSVRGTTPTPLKCLPPTVRNPLTQEVFL